MSKYNGYKYNKLFDIFKIHRLETFMITAISFQIIAVIQNIIMLPIQLLSRIYSLKSNIYDLENWLRIILLFTRITIIIISSLVLAHFTNPSVIYH